MTKKRGPGRQAGGKNPNAGRKLISDHPRVKINITIDADHLRFVDALANEQGISRSQAINVMLEQAIAVY